MARLARLVIPGVPYHITQRGNRRQQTFFENGDYALYRNLLADAARRAGTSVWSYCLMPNHVHLIVVPSHPDGLRQAFADAHRRYTAFINARHRWTGHLWQGRYGAVAMDEAHLAAAARYVALNPVRARLTERAEDWAWSSVRAHLAGEDDELVEVSPMLDRYGDFALFLGSTEDQQATRALRQAETTGRPAGGADWIAELEIASGRQLAPKKRGPKAKDSFVHLVNCHRNTDKRTLFHELAHSPQWSSGMITRPGYIGMAIISSIRILTRGDTLSQQAIHDEISVERMANADRDALMDAYDWAGRPCD